MWKVLVKRTLLSILSLFFLSGLSVWMDARYNSANLLRRATEYCLSNKDISVRIGNIVPNYFDRLFVLKDLEIDIQSSNVFKIDELTCLVSLKKGDWSILNASIAFSNVRSPLIPDLYLQNLKALFSLNLIKSNHFASFRDKNNKEIGKILMEPGVIEAEISQIDSDAKIQGSGMLSFVYRKDFCQIQSRGSVTGILVSMSEIGKVLDFIPKVKCDVASCGWEIDYIKKGKEKDEISNFRNFILSANLINCFGNAKFAPIKQIKACVSLRDNKFVGSITSDELGKGKDHIMELECKKGKIFGCGFLEANLAPLIKRLFYSDNTIVDFIFEKKLQWSYSYDIKHRDFTFDIEGQFSKADLLISNQKLVISNIFAHANFRQEGLKLDAKGIVSKFNANILYNGTFSNEGLHSAEIKAHLSKTIQTPTFRIEPGFVLIRCEIIKDKNYGHKFCADCDLTKLGLFYEKMAFEKMCEKHLVLKVNGIADADKTFFKFNLIGADSLAIDGSCDLNYSNFCLDLQNVCYDRNSYGAKIEISPKGTKTHIKGEVLDLAQANLLDWVKPVFCDKESQLIVEVDFMHMKNGKTVSNSYLNSFYNGKYYTKSTFQGYLDSGAFVNVTLKAFDEQSIEEKWTFASDNAGEVVSALGLYDGMDLGSLKIDFTTNRSEISKDNIYPFISGEVKIGKFHLKDAPHPILSLLCPSILLRPFSKNKYFVFDSLVSSFYLDKGALNIERALAKSFSHAVSIRNAQISPGVSPIVISGEIAPSWYGVGSIARSIPIFGQMVNRMKLPGFWIPYKVQIQI